MTLAEKFTRLKTSVGGNREKMHFEDTFGMPKEEQAHITRPGRANAANARPKPPTEPLQPFF